MHIFHLARVKNTLVEKTGGGVALTNYNKVLMWAACQSNSNYDCNKMIATYNYTFEWTEAL